MGVGHMTQYTDVILKAVYLKFICKEIYNREKYLYIYNVIKQHYYPPQKLKNLKELAPKELLVQKDER